MKKEREREWEMGEEEEKGSKRGFSPINPYTHVISLQSSLDLHIPRLPNTMNRLHIIIHQGKSPQVTLAYLRIALSPARGLINFFLFALLSLSTSPKPTSSAAATAIYTQGEIESRERARDSAATLRHDFPVWSGTPIYQPHVLGDGLGKSMEDGDAHSTSETILASPCADSRRLSIPPTVHYWDGKPSDLEQDKGGKL